MQGSAAVSTIRRVIRDSDFNQFVAAAATAHLTQNIYL